MALPTFLRAESRTALIRSVVVPTALTLVLLTALVGSVLHFSTSTSDDLAASRQTRLIRIAVYQSLRQIATDQEASTYWDDAVLKLREPKLDEEWLDNNLGIWFHTYYGHDETYLLDAGDRPVYAMQSGVRAPARSFQRIASPVLTLAKSLRSRLNSGYVAPSGSPGKTIGVSDIALVDGHPAIISVKPIVSETGGIEQVSGSEFLHVSLRYLDGSFLTGLSRLYGIDEASFSLQARGAGSLPIRTAGGRTLGYLNWTPFDPGEQVETQMQPVLFLALVVVGLFISFLQFRVWRSRTELEASRAQAQHLAFHDSLTGLPNRALFEDRLDHALSRRDNKVAVLLLDLDRFKIVNDTLGHQAGDALIQEFGLRLSSLTREADTISRLGGDEFAVIIEQCSRAEIFSLAKRILDDVGRPFEILGNQVHVGVSIGIALDNQRSTERVELVRRADIALYHAKDSGRNIFCLFKPHMDESVRLRGVVEDELRAALSTGTGLCLHYQPQVGTEGAIIGLEALVRWEHPTRGLIPPEQFLPVAEDSGLIAPLGDWVLREACLMSRRWPHLFVAVNLSPVQFRAAGFSERLEAIVRSTGAKPAAIQLEVTERVLLDDDDAVRAALGKLRSAGFTIVLDDFGTGYSSLSYLRKFEVDKIKIDRSFVQHLGEASDSGSIVSAVLALGQAMGLSVAAEGVETADQTSFLKAAGCREMQGYYFSRAVPPEGLEALLGAPRRASSAA